MRAELSELRRSFLILVGSVVALDAVVIAAYYAMHVADRPAKTQQSFVAVWVVITIAVLMVGMRRVRRARRSLRGPGRGA